MAFYIFPPKGNLSLGKLKLYTRKRLDFLMKLAGNTSKGNRIESWTRMSPVHTPTLIHTPLPLCSHLPLCPGACWNTHPPAQVHAGIHTPCPGACWNTPPSTEWHMHAKIEPSASRAVNMEQCLIAMSRQWSYLLTVAIHLDGYVAAIVYWLPLFVNKCK